MRHLSLSCFLFFFSTFGLKSPPPPLVRVIMDFSCVQTSRLRLLAPQLSIRKKRLLMLCTWPSLSLNSCTFKATVSNCSMSSCSERINDKKGLNGKPTQRRTHGSAFIYPLFTPAGAFTYDYVVGVFIFIVICFASSATGRWQPTWQTGLILKVCPHTWSYSHPVIR